MKLTEYATQRVRLDHQLRASSRILAYAVDAFRLAGVAALVLLVSDVTPWPVMADHGARGRLVFIAMWALLVALGNLVLRPTLDAVGEPDRDSAT